MSVGVFIREQQRLEKNKPKEIKKKKHIVLLHSTKCVLVCTAGLVSYNTFARSTKSLSFKTFNRSVASSQSLDGRLLSLSILISIALESSLLFSFEDGNEGFDYYDEK